jgi:hypothetical protein
MIKKILWVLLIILIIMQFIHPARNISKGEQPNNIAKAYAIPPDVKTVLDKACMDCHSNNTRYLWYFHLQPVDWWLTKHINEGKRELNFDEFANKSPRYQFNKMENLIDQVKKGEMPLKSYTWIHKDAILTDEEKKAITSWAEGVRTELRAKYPEDSLKRKPRPQPQGK